VTTITALGLSQPFASVWLTQWEVLPAAAVEGTGAVALPVPPVATVYHNRFVPVAVRAVAVSFRQYITGVVTAGAGGKGSVLIKFCWTLILLPQPSVTL